MTVALVLFVNDYRRQWRLQLYTLLVVVYCTVIGQPSCKQKFPPKTHLVSQCSFCKSQQNLSYAFIMKF